MTTTPDTLAKLSADERTELLDWVSACQSAYHIDSTPGHRFGGLGSNLDEKREALVDHVESIIAERVRALTAQALPAAEPFGYFKAEPFGWTDCAETDEGAIALYEHPQQAAQATAGWVSVADRLPPPFENVVVHPRPTEYCCEAQVNTQGAWQYHEYEHNFGVNHFKCEVTHWWSSPPPAALPQPPQPQSAQPQEDAA